MTLMNEVEDLKKKKTLAEVSAYSPKPAAHVYSVVVFHIINLVIRWWYKQCRVFSRPFFSRVKLNFLGVKIHSLQVKH